MGKIEHKNGQVGSGVALNMIKANSSQPFSLTSSPVNQGDGSRLKKKINKLSDKHAGLYNAVIEGHGQNEYTSGNYDKDMKKLHKVEDRLEKKEKKYQEKFGESPYGHSISDEMKNATMEWVKNSVGSISPTGPRMEGPLNNQTRFDKTVSKAEEALEKGNYRKAFRKSKSAARQAGLGNAEVNFKTWKSDQGLSMKGPLNKEGWIQEATESIKRRGTEGVCTGDKFGSASCPPGSKRYNLAKTFKKMAKNRK